MFKIIGIQEDHHLYILEIFLPIPSQMSGCNALNVEGPDHFSESV